ncbi:hypothetical protein COL922a_000860 [Colletotrichum nupharicola]|nr:hypothetical protein CBS470a_012071 [Colletotrichum nupharicola]KAJ0342585.1 hypothetical protein COL922a_000860 [Colletotrichum nupharicola]
MPRLRWPQTVSQDVQSQMYEKLGYEWATSLLAFLTVAMMPFPWLFFKYGKKLRGRSRFAVRTK